MAKKEKILPINKYSIFELKAAEDKEIHSYLEEKEFEENQ